MQRAHEVMTHALATCAPDATVAQVAGIMRDRDVGSVLVVEDGKLRGIVTDRDLAMQALTGNDHPLQTPIHKFMSAKVVTGDTGWSLERVAETMAKHQIRRLPIVQDGQLAGIVSLGDVARHEGRMSVVVRLLRTISTPTGVSARGRSGLGGAIAGLSLAGLAASVLAWLAWNHNGRTLREQVSKSQFYHTAQGALGVARGRVDGAASSKLAGNLRQQIHADLDGLSAKLPTLEYKPATDKHSWFH
jgi:CBS domain-containing protein